MFNRNIKLTINCNYHVMQVDFRQTVGLECLLEEFFITLGQRFWQ